MTSSKRPPSASPPGTPREINPPQALTLGGLTETSLADLAFVKGYSKESLRWKLKPLPLQSLTPDHISSNIKAMPPEFSSIKMLRVLVVTRDIGCPLCAYHDWTGVAEAHKLKRCNQSIPNAAQPWLDMFEKYEAKSGGSGATCEECRFPEDLCWRHFYHKTMNDKYGNKLDAPNDHGIHYRDVQCDWVRVMQRNVTAAMIAGGVVDSTGTSVIGQRILREMGWTDWESLKQQGPEQIREWLQENDEINDVKCPRLLRLFLTVAICTYDLEEWKHLAGELREGRTTPAGGPHF